MKKPHIVLLSVAVCFVCIVVGIFIGRNFIPNYYMPHYTPTVSDSENLNSSELGKININTASVQQLSQLPGIGPVTAQNIVDYRTENGNFETIYDLLDVAGIGKQTMKNIGELVTTGG